MQIKFLIVLLVAVSSAINCDVMGQSNSLKKIESEKPNGYFIDEFYPNPFGVSTSLKVYIPDSSFVSAKIYNNQKELVRQLHKGEVDGGVYQLSWDLKTDKGEKIKESGEYFLNVEISSNHGKYKTRKMSFLSEIKMTLVF